VHVFTTIGLHVNWKANVACNFNYLIKAERLFSGSQAVNIYRKTGNILEMVRDVATLLLLTTNTTPYNRFMALFPRPPRWAGARTKLLLVFMELGRITKGRHTENPVGHHSMRTNQQSTSINPPFLHWMPFLLQHFQFILAWGRQKNMMDCISPWLAYWQQLPPPHTTTVLQPFFRDHPGQPVPEQNF